jgi:Tol biopolymer transport system component
VNFDGSNFKTLATSGDQSLFPHWSPDGTRIVYYEADPGSNSRLTLVDVNGTKNTLVSPPQLTAASYPRFSSDGWVYFNGLDGSYRSSIYRVRPDGTSLSPLAPPTTDYSALRPSPSPDGETVVFESRGSLYLQDVATGAITALNILGMMPAFSPDGARIAYISQTLALNVADKNGTNVRQISPTGLTFEELGGVDWTADGQWALGRANGLWRLINVSDSRQIPMTFSGPDLQLSVKR